MDELDLIGGEIPCVPIAFGHWSTLGLVDRPDLLAIDTGCVWGGALTAVRLDGASRSDDAEADSPAIAGHVRRLGLEPLRSCGSYDRMTATARRIR